MDIEKLPKLSGKKLDIWLQLLRRTGLQPDDRIDCTLLIWDGDTLIATGSRKGNLLKCIAVDHAHQGEDLTATVLTHLRQDALQAGLRHLFLYTKPQNEFLFSSLFFYPIASTQAVLLMENKPNGIGDFLDSLPAPVTQGTIGSVVMNCNPFTVGHRHLIESATKACDWLYVFVLSEDCSHFSASDRMAMVQSGTADLTNVTVLPTGPYLISSATFPVYFLKEPSEATKVQCQLDATVFAQYYGKKFGITCRFVGSEPYCPVTETYNQILAELLPKHGIALHQIPRKECNGVPISATIVRRLLSQKNPDAIRELVPETTYTYLQDHNLL